jgi:solute carrier family 25 carnitine/acylcarnitine transporter 20/29
MQTDSFDSAHRRYKGWWHCLRVTLKTEGLQGLYRGSIPCMLRAAPVNAATFVAYEFAMNLLGRRNV